MSNSRRRRSGPSPADVVIDSMRAKVEAHGDAEGALRVALRVAAKLDGVARILTCARKGADAFDWASLSDASLASLHFDLMLREVGFDAANEGTELARLARDVGRAQNIAWSAVVAARKPGPVAARRPAVAAEPVAAEPIESSDCPMVPTEKVAVEPADAEVAP